MKQDLLLAAAIGAGVLSSYLIYAGDAMAQDLVQILYLHVPAAWIAYLSFTLSFLSCLLYLRTRNAIYDTAADATAIMGLVYGAVALATGAIWAEAAWGSYWNWDPRETTTLILWIAYAGYLSLRFSMAEGRRRSVVSAVYNILAFFTIPLSYLSVTFVPTLHPQIVTMSGISLSPAILGTLLVSLAAATLLYAYLLVTALSVSAAEESLATRFANHAGGA